MNIFNFSDMAESFRSTWLRFIGAVGSLNTINDILDILFVAVVVYALIIQLRKSQSIQIIKGIVFVIVLYGVVYALQMKASKFIFNSLLGNMLLILVVLFSDELRQSLERLGQRNAPSLIRGLFSSGSDTNATFDTINSVCRACSMMSEQKIGSLIIFQRDSLLGNMTEKAVKIDSVVTTDMLMSVFFPKAALHDGAIVIDNNRILAARCVVPLKNEKNIITDHVGTRHRAALEVSLHSDAVAVVTSEESGIISIAVDGRLDRGLTDGELRERLIDLLIKPEDEGKRTGLLSRIKRTGGDRNG